jgi:hypothetical protein
MYVYDTDIEAIGISCYVFSQSIKAKSTTKTIPTIDKTET